MWLPSVTSSRNRAEGGRHLARREDDPVDAGRVSAGLWTGRSGLRRLEVRGCELLDVDVLERHDLDVLGEAGRPVHVPYPGVAHGDLEVRVTRLGADLQVDLVAQVE